MSQPLSTRPLCVRIISFLHIRMKLIRHLNSLMKMTIAQLLPLKERQLCRRIHNISYLASIQLIPRQCYFILYGVESVAIRR